MQVLSPSSLQSLTSSLGCGSQPISVSALSAVPTSTSQPTTTAIPTQILPGGAQIISEWLRLQRELITQIKLVIEFHAHWLVPVYFSWCLVWSCMSKFSRIVILAQQNRYHLNSIHANTTLIPHYNQMLSKLVPLVHGRGHFWICKALHNFERLFIGKVYYYVILWLTIFLPHLLLHDYRCQWTTRREWWCQVGGVNWRAGEPGTGGAATRGLPHHGHRENKTEASGLYLPQL